ncbi:binding-protein-dependent transport systems inner membrane component [Candidatus Moduliflexus flocculans]|uniref:Binding-protein-dependent transport systems inner membrane component n=1 Tax=Candidatus Moduliflexus flocculans TaxID=1499966 RepID=A0A081BRP2_9BACT|nr:binding-protein-dependent transport systems inner membrane component [Candidatus Moduliflexus flocculans]
MTAIKSAQSHNIAAMPKKKRMNRWDNPWLNTKFLTGGAMVLAVVLLGTVGPFFWDVKLARVGSAELNLPPMGITIEVDGVEYVGTAKNPLGTESNGRDILATLIAGAPMSLQVGVVAAVIGMTIGVILGAAAGYLGGWVDNVIRTLADAWITIPALAVLITMAAYVRQIELSTMSLILAVFAWPAPTRFVRAQVLTLRERGYVRMARLSGVPPLQIMLKEMIPNMLPWLAASLSGNISGNILAASSLEALGLGPTRIPTLGMIIYYAIRAAAILRGMWWWWGFPILILIFIFTGLFLIATGLDEISNPRLRGVV